jgi:uncharacterized membrane protein
MPVLVAVHATAATLALLLGPVNVVRRPKGDTFHRRLGFVWVAAMYLLIVTSFGIRELHPGHFSFFHALSIFTFCTLTLGLYSAARGNIQAHRGNMIGSYLGVLGAFVGAVVVPSRRIPRLAVHHPVVLSLAALACLALAAAIVTLVRPRAGTEPATTLDQGPSPLPTR